MSTKTDMSREAVTHRLRQMEGLWLLSKALADAKVLRKNGSGKNRGLEIQAAIRDTLLREWNPSGLGGRDDVDRSYDQYVAPILRILVGSRREDDLVKCLEAISRNHTGADPDTGGVQELAKRLLGLNVTLK